MTSHWLIKSEPGTYAFADLMREKRAVWDGIRNFAARNNLRAMKRADLLLYYHTGDEKQVVGVAKVTRSAYADPSATEGDWSAVDVAPVKALKQPVTLAQMKQERALAGFALLRQGRLSVVPVSPAQFSHILGLGLTKL